MNTNVLIETTHSCEIDGHARLVVRMATTMRKLCIHEGLVMTLPMQERVNANADQINL